MPDPTGALGHRDARSSGVAIVVPVHRGGDGLVRCLEGIAGGDPRADEVVVAVDGPVAGARQTAEGYGFRVVESADRAGPASARNLGARATTAPLILFVDSDVVIPPHTVGRVASCLAERPDVAAVFGSYDERPSASGFVSQYKNLFHHFTHQHGAREAATFWTGCGAIRRAVFESVGGFDSRQAWLEDVELGYRLRAAGHRIHLDPTLQVTHLKCWTFATMVRSDVFHRALPWTELIHRYRRLPNDLNLRVAGRISVALVLALVASLAAAAWWPGAVIASLAAAIALLAVNWPFYGFLAGRRGAAFAFRAVPVHWLYLLYSGAGFAVGSAWYAMSATRPGARQGSIDSDRRRSP
jgi:GT2 family glycosyltransferase